jgi:hypothetical protein
MSRYALLIQAATNRVYAGASISLTQTEIALFADTVLGARVSSVDAARIGGVPYVVFEADPALDPHDSALLSNLSSMYALFEVHGDLLRPVELDRLDRFDDDLITIQKYSGKTNEQFTKLLFNATLLSSAFASEFGSRRFRVLDPLCGRGTTLNQAMMYGFDAYGIEADRKDFEAYASFIETWLKRKRIKHRITSGAVRRNKRLLGRKLEVTFATDKESFRAGDAQRIEVVNADTVLAAEFFRPDNFDLVVADAPYGVQHGSRTEAAGLRRSPLELLRTAVPVWTELLRPGGALGISWNAHVASRDDAVAVLAGAGLEPLTNAPYRQFEHRVDQAIVRDIVIARKA